jgi:hypothetical protein
VKVPGIVAFVLTPHFLQRCFALPPNVKCFFQLRTVEGGITFHHTISTVENHLKRACLLTALYTFGYKWYTSVEEGSASLLADPDLNPAFHVDVQVQVTKLKFLCDKTKMKL